MKAWAKTVRPLILMKSSLISTIHTLRKILKKKFGDVVTEKIDIQKQKNGLYECVLDADQIIIKEF